MRPSTPCRHTSRFLEFATKCGLVDRKLTLEDAELIYTPEAKLSKKKALGFERFHEGLRQMAVHKFLV